MPAFSQWDRLVVPYIDAGHSDKHDTETLRERQRIRVQQFDTLVLQAIDTEIQPDHRQAIAAVRDDYHARVTAWKRWYRRPWLDDDLTRWARSLARDAIGFVVAIPFVLAFAVLRRTLLIARMNRIQRAVVRGRCPDCRFDLSATPLPLSEKTLGIWIGPAQCTECGAPWPLLPPRVPDRVAIM